MHREEHLRSSDVITDVVIGMSDGLTVPFALAAGLSGAVTSSSLVVTAGIAEIVAGAIAMGLGGYLAGRTESDHYQSERRREQVEVETVPEREKDEVREVFADMGLSPALLLADSSVTAQPLLPSKMIFTQQVFWGPKGLLRIMNVAPLTPEGRARELKVRRTMLVGHQIMGFVTLAGFVAQGIVGAKLYNSSGDRYGQLKDTHSMLASAVNITYATTALLSLTAPPKMLSERRGLSSIKLHKYLAVVHIAGMIATNVLSGMLESNPDVKPYHRAAAYTTSCRGLPLPDISQ